MSPVLIISILIRLITAGYTLVVWKRIRDWRMIFMTAMVTLMAVRQSATLISKLSQSVSNGFTAQVELTELPGLTSA